MLAITAVVLIAIALLFWFHITNPFNRISIFKKPYTTTVSKTGDIDYVQNYQLRVYATQFANILGYVKSGFLIVHNTAFGGRRAHGTSVEAITASIHRIRFNAKYPYLISGDQFSVLYPRNLGVFYNQLLDPNTALDESDWVARQQIYMQSVLISIDGLSASKNPRTTIIPIGPRHAVLTQVHPGGIGSDQVYGLFYALTTLLKKTKSDNGQYIQKTHKAAARILDERREQLQFIYDSYIEKIYEPDTELVKRNLHLASARDGVIRSSSLYDNLIMYETIRLAEKLGLRDNLNISIAAVERRLKDYYWNDEAGYYNDDVHTPHFSSDWLIGFVTGFFKLSSVQDLERTIRTVNHIESTGLAHPLPIKYQNHHDAVRVPAFVKWFVPSYGSSAIWSYWGAQYITLLVDLYEVTGDEQYVELAQKYADLYDQCIIRDAGFAETFDAQGQFLRSTLYKSIRITGWVVQFEHAKYKLGLQAKKR